jgi:hypothetical protein
MTHKISKIAKELTGLLIVICSLLFSVACSDFLYDDSDIVTYADREHLVSDADTLWSVAGIMNKMQALADRTILLGELRGDLVSITDNADADIREVASFSIATGNRYNNPADYYAVINNCNYFIAHADTALENNRNESIFMKEYAAVKAFRAWTYLQLALNYGKVPFITEPIVSKEQSEQEFPMYGINDICRFFIADLAPYADIEQPGYATIRNTDSSLFYFPIYILLGDMNLWAGNYRAAAENYYKFITMRNGRNSSFPISTNSVRFMSNDSHWTATADTWSVNAFQTETRSAYGELITMIPGDSIPSEGNYSELRDLFNTTERNEYKESIRPSEALYSLSALQRYCHYTSGGEYVFSPDGLDGHRSGDLRLQAVYNESNNMAISVNGKRIENYVTNGKYQTRNIHLYRRAMVYLRMAEALNRAGFPRFAFQILKRGVNNSVIETEVVPYYESDAAWLRTFSFPDNRYVLETTAGAASENTIGLHSRGCGYTAANSTYTMPDSEQLTGQQLLDYQIQKVEDMIMDEEALEFAFEGHRFYDLMRVALHRGNPAYLADHVARRSGTVDASLQQKLLTTGSWYMTLPE